MEDNALYIEERKGEPWIVNAPLPEHITIHRELWDELTEEGKARDWVTLTPIEHADADRENDGYVVAFDASNVTCSYRVAAVPADGPISGVLASWGEK